MTDVTRRLDLCKGAEKAAKKATKKLTKKEKEKLQKQSKAEQEIIDLATHNGFECDFQKPPGEYEQAVMFLDGLDEIKPIE